MKHSKVAILISKASLIFDKTANYYEHTLGLTVSQYKVIKYVLCNYEKGIRITDAEHYFSMTHPTVIGIVKNLEKKGMVRYEPNPNDARSRWLMPTEKALAMRAQIDEAGETVEKELVKRLSRDEREQLVRLLQKMLGLDD